MKSSQSIPGPQSGTSPVTGGVMAGSPQVAQAVAADPSPVSQVVTPPKPAYDDADVAPSPASGSQSQNPLSYMLKVAATHPNDQGQIVADALRRFAPNFRTPYDTLGNPARPYGTSAGSSQSPERRSLGGWQSLMQRMRPQ